MAEQNYALGMIETIGYTGLVAALDTALKTADVHLKTYQRADAGIVTIYIVGDVASVTVAVEVGAESAKRIGHLHGKHVIARPEQHTLDMILGTEKATKESVEIAEKVVEPEEQAKVPTAEVVEDNPKQVSDARTIEEYQLLTMKELKEIVSTRKDINLTKKQIAKIRKDDLINKLIGSELTKGGDDE